MSGAMTNYELGKSTHREYEAQFSRYWGQHQARDRESISTTGRRFALALRSALAGMLLACLPIDILR
jgi:hypothetical protein